ncbi:Chondroitin AC lyase [Bacteroides helcogenes P 36-108]|uniref:Chondroitin AC lyase n=2 Tax=Bacteroides helcogenes TaxID=290053 RepID=E6SWK8_BACT6|nr:Chondroitin AC lyase [Bacteroides helcogenes P 36-108]
MNPSKLIIITAIFILSISAKAHASDFDIIYSRMYETYLAKNPSKTTIDGLIALMTSEGAFVNINYHTTDGSPRKHLQNLITMACAYQHPQNIYHHKKELKVAYLKGLRFWIETDHQAKNWWYRYIPYPKEMSAGVILMSKEIMPDKELFDKTMEYLRWSYKNAAPSHMTGANGADIIMGAFAASILTRNDAQMEEFKEKMTQLLTIQHVEGIQPDYLFGQHCGNGRQLYFTSYGKEFVNSMLSYLEFCKDTKYQSSGTELLQKLFINGVQWIFYSKQYDPNNAGRFISPDQYSSAIKALTERVYKLSKPETGKNIKLALQRIAGENSLEGNRMFWRFDYMVHRRTRYMTSSRMTSTRTVGNEAGNGDGEFNYYAANGVNYLFVTGKEYDRDFFKRFNNRQYPGITAEQDNDPLPVPNWGEGGGNGSIFAGGVSDSIYGACGMILNRRGLEARKSWFYFDNEFICLGVGIRTPGGKAEVFTTVNQCNRDGKVQYMQNGKKFILKEDKAQTNADWIIHGRTGYFNLLPGTEYLIACDTALFSLNISHGIRPQDGTYAYLVHPGLSNASEAMKYAKNIPVKILANTEKVQAVRHETLALTEAVFYQSGELKADNGDILSVDAPCTLLWDENEQKINIANPYCESMNPETVRVTLVRKGSPVTLSFTMPRQEMAGMSVSLRY